MAVKDEMVGELIRVLDKAAGSSKFVRTSG